MIEETGVKPDIGKLLFVQQYSDDEDREFLEFFFQIKNIDDYDEIDLKNTSHGLIETEENKFIDTKTNIVLPAFLQEINIESYINNNLPVYFYNKL